MPDELGVAVCDGVLVVVGSAVDDVLARERKQGSRTLPISSPGGLIAPQLILGLPQHIIVCASLREHACWLPPTLIAT